MGVGSPGGSRNEAQEQFIRLMCFESKCMLQGTSWGRCPATPHMGPFWGSKRESYICSSPFLLFFVAEQGLPQPQISFVRSKSCGVSLIVHAHDIVIGGGF